VRKSKGSGDSKARAKSHAKNPASLRALGKSPPTTLESISIFDAVLADGPALQIAVLGGSVVEYELEQLLRGYVSRRDDATWKELTDDRAPLGTFSAKIIMAYALGLIDNDTRQNLDVVRHIRNAFAHSKRLIDFSHIAIANAIHAVKLSTFGNPARDEALKIAADPTNSAQTRFQCLAASLAVELSHLLIRLKSRPVAQKTPESEPSGK